MTNTEFTLDQLQTICGAGAEEHDGSGVRKDAICDITKNGSKGVISITPEGVLFIQVLVFDLWTYRSAASGVLL